jgi:hypothetical protein
MCETSTQKRSPIVLAAVAATVGVIRVFGEHASVSAAVPADLPGGLTSPEQWVLCNPERGVCFDRMGASIGLTKAFLGPEAAAHLTDVLREIADRSSSSSFAPANGVECGVKTGHCRVNGVAHAELTDILYGPPPLRAENSVPPMLLRSEWKWQVTRFNDDTASEPPEPGNYTLRIEPDGTLHAPSGLQSRRRSIPGDRNADPHRDKPFDAGCLPAGFARYGFPARSQSRDALRDQGRSAIPGSGNAHWNHGARAMRAAAKFPRACANSR